MIHCSKTTLAESHEYLFNVYKQHSKDVHPGVYPEEVELSISQIIDGEKNNTFFSVKAELENEVVGLISGYVGVHMQYKNHIFACTSFIQAKKELPTRVRIQILKDLISKFEEVAKKDYNCSYVQVTLSAGKDIRKLIEPLNYKTTDYVLGKKL